MKRNRHIVYVIGFLFFFLVLYSLKDMIFQPPKNKIVRVDEKFVESAEYVIPKIIWSYWNNDTPPDIIKQILENREKTLISWNIRHITNSNIDTYINKNDIPFKYKYLSPEHQSDWIRLYVLKKYGGVWMDCSIIVNSSKNLDQLYKKSMNEKSELTGFSYKNKLLNGEMTSYIENWFIMAPRGSQVIEYWYKEYMNAINMGFHEYKDKLLDEGIFLSNLYDPFDLNVYLTQHSCLQYVLKNYFKYKPKILLDDASESMFKLQTDCGWDDKCLAEKIEKDPDAKNIPYIKLTGSNRKHLSNLTDYFSS